MPVYMSVRAVFMQRTGDIAVNQHVEPINNRRWIFLHALANPVQHQADKRVFVEVGNERLVTVTDGQPDGFFLNHANQQVVRQLIEIALQVLTADRVVDVQDERFVFQDKMEDVQEALLPCAVRLVAGKRDARILLTRPLYQVVYICKMVVERHPADTAVLSNIVDGDFVQRLLQKQLSA